MLLTDFVLKTYVHITWLCFDDDVSDHLKSLASPTPLILMLTNNTNM